MYDGIEPWKPSLEIYRLFVGVSPAFLDGQRSCTLWTKSTFHSALSPMPEHILKRRRLSSYTSLSLPPAGAFGYFRGVYITVSFFLTSAALLCKTFTSIFVYRNKLSCVSTQFRLWTSLSKSTHFALLAAQLRNENPRFTTLSNALHLEDSSFLRGTTSAVPFICPDTNLRALRIRSPPSFQHQFCPASISFDRRDIMGGAGVAHFNFLLRPVQTA